MLLKEKNTEKIDLTRQDDGRSLSKCTEMLPQKYKNSKLNFDDMVLQNLESMKSMLARTDCKLDNAADRIVKRLVKRLVL